jgi:type II secretory pathway pseudopilin PulG
MFCIQASIQPFSFIVLPVAFLFTVPFGWVFAFYQTVLVQDYNTRTTLKKRIKASAALSAMWPAQNYKILFIISVLSVVIFINTAMIIYSIPLILKKVADIDSAFTMGGFSFFNTTFIFTVLIITWCLTDPIIKSVYALRIFYGESMKTGKDLIVELNTRRGKKISAAIIIFTVIASVSLPAVSYGKNTTISETAVIDGTTIDSAVEKVLKQSEFAWKIPGEMTPKNDKGGWLHSFLNWLKPYTKSVIDFIKKSAKGLDDFLSRLVPFRNPDSDENDSSITSALLQPAILILSALICVVLIASLVRVLFSAKKKPVRQPGETSETEKTIPDVEDESIPADQFPPDEWFRLFQSLVEKGELRLAVRALYLGTLSNLSDRGYIAVSLNKSNQDYVQELGRRGAGDPGMQSLFRKSVTFFDRIWYGMHDVSVQEVNNYLEEQTRIGTLAGD